jgi:hypothetical protein
MWFSWDLANVHFIAYSSEVSLRHHESTQHTFCITYLSRAYSHSDACVVACHRSTLSIANGSPCNTLGWRMTFAWPIRTGPDPTRSHPNLLGS